jgi:hypothetical protein
MWLPRAGVARQVAFELVLLGELEEVLDPHPVNVGASRMMNVLHLEDL